MLKLRPVLFICLIGDAGLACAQAENTPTFSAKIGEPIVVASGPCIEGYKSSGAGELKPAPAKDKVELQYTPPKDGAADVTITYALGAPPPAGSTACLNPVQQNVRVLVNTAPEVPAWALNDAFRILVGAFVLALLLESAFALLFNWRLFQEHFVGKAWRTPIMFFVSLLVVKQFDLDLIASLFNAYHGGRANVEGDTLTAILTAMVIGGGSVGVNRIMVGLGFRSPVSKADEEKPRLARNEAYVSVEIKGSKSGRRFAVSISEADATGLPATLGLVPSPQRSSLFPNRARLPNSGGFRLSSDKAYRISIEDILAHARYDVTGKPLAANEQPTLYRFASGALIDFVADIDTSLPVT